MASFSEYYQRELSLLRERAAAFARSHPGLAALLEESSTDPDVERLLEGVAFLSADIRLWADDEFGEVVDALAQTVCPHLLEPMPAATVVAFQPKANLKQTQTVRAGTQLASTPVDGEPCHFATSWDTPVAPLSLTDAELLREDEVGEGEGQRRRIRLSLSSGETPVNAFELSALRLYVAGEFAHAADVHMLLVYYLRGVQVIDRATGVVEELPHSVVRPMGFRAEEGLIDRPGSTLPAFGALEDYFLFAEKFLFLELDLSQWSQRGTGTRFDVIFVCEPPPFPVPKIDRERFILHATPATNTFELESEPVLIDQRQSEYAVKPRGGERGNIVIKSIASVEGIARGGAARRAYAPFSGYVSGASKQAVYKQKRRREPAGDGTEVSVAVALPPGETFHFREALKARLICTNGEAPEGLLPGDVQTPTADTPELVTFTNVTAPTQPRKALLDSTQLWHLISHLSLNYLSLANAANLRSMLRQYAVRTDEQRARDMPNLKRIDSVIWLDVRPVEHILGDCFVRGQSIRVRIRKEDFNGYGDRHLFGSVLNYLFANYAAVNAFTQLELEDNATGECLRWAATFGERALV